MLLSREVQVWETYLNGEAFASRPAQWIWRKLLGVMPIWLVLAVVRVAISTSVPDFLASLVGLLPQYSAGTAAFLLVNRSGQIATLLRHARCLAEAMELDNAQDKDALQAMGRCAGLVRFVRRAVGVYLPVGLSMLVLQQVLGDSPAPTIGEERAHEYPLAHALVIVNEAVKWAYYAVSYFVLWALLASVLAALHGMYDTLIRRLSSARGFFQVRDSAKQFQELLDLQIELKKLTFQPLLHILAGAGVVPLINTYQMMRGMANVFSILTFSTLPFVFGTLSALGDGLELRAERVAKAAFSEINVLGEPKAASKLRLMLIARAGGHQSHPSGFSMRGFGNLNLRAAFNALQRWYQYLQLLMGSS